MQENKLANFERELRQITPLEILAYLEIAERIYFEIAAHSGMSAEEARARRKQIIAEEIAEIDAERERLANEDRIDP